MKIFKSKKPANRCLFCNTSILESSYKNEIAIGHAEGSSVFGYACNSCAIILDDLEKDTGSFEDMVGDDDDSL